jgi:hypothetical protein
VGDTTKSKINNPTKNGEEKKREKKIEARILILPAGKA